MPINITINGNPDKEQIIEALKLEEEKFKSLLREVFENERNTKMNLIDYITCLHTINHSRQVKCCIKDDIVIDAPCNWDIPNKQDMENLTTIRELLEIVERWRKGGEPDEESKAEKDRKDGQSAGTA